MEPPMNSFLVFCVLGCPFTASTVRRKAGHRRQASCWIYKNVTLLRAH